MLIRKATIADLPFITKFAVELINLHADFDPYYEPAKNVKDVYFKCFKSYIGSSSKLLLVAVDVGEIIGFAAGEICGRAPVFAIKKNGLISDIYVEKTWREKGVAQLFISKLFDWFKTKKVPCVELTVHVKNEVGQKVWAKYGFKTYMSKQRVEMK